jgi:hypothetical protein
LLHALFIFIRRFILPGGRDKGQDLAAADGYQEKVS